VGSEGSPCGSRILVSEVIDHGFIHSIYSFDPNGSPSSSAVRGRCRHQGRARLADGNLGVAREGTTLQPDTGPRDADDAGCGARRLPGAGASIFWKNRVTIATAGATLLTVGRRRLSALGTEKGEHRTCADS